MSDTVDKDHETQLTFSTRNKAPHYTGEVVDQFWYVALGLTQVLQGEIAHAHTMITVSTTPQRLLVLTSKVM